MLLTDLALLAMAYGVGAPFLETGLDRHPHLDAQAVVIPWNGATPHLPHMPEPGPYAPGPSLQYVSVQASRTATWAGVSENAWLFSPSHMDV